MSKKILVVAAHPDDEVLGCGGSLARHRSEGDQIYVVFMSDGVSSRDESDDVSIHARLDSAANSQKILGITEHFFLDFPDNSLDSVPFLEIVKSLEEIVFNLKPQVIYTHHYGDLNLDHELTCRAVLTVCRPIPNFFVKEIYGFEIMSSTEWAIPTKNSFEPIKFVDIEHFINIKIDALNAYRQEMRPVPHSRSLEHIVALSKHRGYSVGLNFAESFEIYRIKE